MHGYPSFITYKRRSFLNNGKSDWNGSKYFNNHRFNELPIPSDVQVNEKELRFILAGRIAEITSKTYAAGLADERGDIYHSNPADLTIKELSLKLANTNGIDGWSN